MGCCGQKRKALLADVMLGTSADNVTRRHREIAPAPDGGTLRGFAKARVRREDSIKQQTPGDQQR